MKQLKVTIPHTWSDISEESDGSLTFVNSTIPDSGVLQISYTAYESGKIPRPSKNDLIEMSRNLALMQNCEVLNTKSGDCKFGIFGNVEAKDQENELISIWYLSDSKNFVLGTFISKNKPIEHIKVEAYEILKQIRKKKFGIF